MEEDKVKKVITKPKGKNIPNVEKTFTDSDKKLLNLIAEIIVNIILEEEVE